jgi:hypothetical protein
MLLHKACRSRFPQTRICNLNKGSQRALWSMSLRMIKLAKTEPQFTHTKP